MATFGGRDYSNEGGGQRPDDRGPGPDVPRETQRREEPQGNDRGGGQQYSERGGYDRGRGGGRGDQGGGNRSDSRGDQGGGNRSDSRGDQGGGNRSDSRGDQGGGNRSDRNGYDRDPNYAFISYLYPTGKNGGFSVFLKRDMLEILKSLEDDDMVGISPSGRDGWMIYARRVSQQQKEDYRHRGGSGGGRGDGYRK